MATLTIESQEKLGLVETTLEELLFPVEMVEYTENACNTDYAFDIFGYIGADGVKTRLNSCSKKYELVKNEEIFPNVRQILTEKNLPFDEIYMQINNARFYADYVIKAFEHRIKGGNDIIYPMLKVQHSYNGLTKYMITFGYYRLVCSNGLTIPVKEKDEFNLCITGKHTQSIQESLKKLFNLIDIFVNQDKSYLINFDILADHVVSDPEARIKEVMQVAKIAMLENKKFNTVSHISSIVNREAIDLYGGVTNDFLIYNGINQYIFDKTLNIKAPEVRNDMDRKVLEYLMA